MSKYKFIYAGYLFAALCPQALAGEIVPVGQSLAATCANCHPIRDCDEPLNTGFKITGRSSTWLVEQMSNFKNGKRPATIMHQIAKGYSDSQIKSIADLHEKQ